MAEGGHALLVRAKDLVLNTDATPASYTFTVDTLAPETTITSAPPVLTNSSGVTFAFTSNEATATFECKLDSAPTFTACTTPVSFSLPDGGNTLQVRAKDLAANTDPTPALYSFTVDTAAPDTTIATGPALSSAVSSASFHFTSDDPFATFECFLDLGPAWVPCTDPKTYTLLADGAHLVGVRAKDLA